MTSEPNDKPGSPKHPDHDRYERELDDEKTELEEIDIIYEEFLVRMKPHLVPYRIKRLQTATRYWVKQQYATTKDMLTKMIRPRTERIESIINFVDMFPTEEGRSKRDDINPEDPLPPESPPSAPKSPKDGDKPKPPPDVDKPKGGKKK